MRDATAIRPAPTPTATTPIVMTLRDLLEAQTALQRLAADRLPIKLAYNVARMIKAIQPDFDEFVKQRNDLVKKYGATRPATDAEKPTHGPEVTEVTPTHLLDFRRELDELTSVDVTIDRAPLAIDSVDKISAADLIALGPLVAEPE